MKSIRKPLITLLFLCTLESSPCSLLQQTEAAEADAFQRVIAPAIKQHCAKCHGAEAEIEGDVNLAKLTGEHLHDDPDLVRSMMEALDLQTMPPEDEPPLSDELREELLRELNVILHTAVARKNQYSPTPIRRMNRFQYNNAVIDLFQLRCIVFTLPERMMRVHGNYFQPETGKMAQQVSVGNRPLGKSQMIEPRLAGVAAFPQDLRAEHGYDNQGDHLSLSPLLMESFLKLGHSITQSKDFKQKNVGIWNEFFLPPESADNLQQELENRLRPFLTQAFRQPVKEELLDRYVTFVTSRLDAGTDFTEAMKLVAAAAISSPRFFYLYEKSVDSTEDKTVSNNKSRVSSHAIDDFELASRLSFFLWGSIPDQTLLDLAAKGTLKEQEVLEAQIERMLKDRKLKRFCDSFPAQWLQLDRLISSVPEREKFPQFYFSKYRDSMHMMLEPLLIFETVLIENHTITQLIDSDFTYRSPLLQDAYGKLGSGAKGGSVGVLKFQRVPVKDRRNGGVITNAAVMTMTSGPERTQPITRGAWVAGVIFNNPPEPPPADVPSLGEKPAEAEKHLTLRERLALHRERSDCKGCHEQIDPLGFALENYNPIGVWREQYENGREIDPSGLLFRKHEFNNVIEFKDAILSEKKLFAHAFAGHLLSYGLARELTAADQIALDQITQTAEEDDFRMQTIIKLVIHSDPFQSKTNPKEPEQEKEHGS